MQWKLKGKKTKTDLSSCCDVRSWLICWDAHPPFPQASKKLHQILSKFKLFFENATLYSLFPPIHLPNLHLTVHRWARTAGQPLPLGLCEKWKTGIWAEGGGRKKASVVQTQKAGQGKRDRSRTEAVFVEVVSRWGIWGTRGARYYYPSLPSALSRWVLAPVTKPPFKTLTALVFFYPSFSFFPSLFFPEEESPSKLLFVKATGGQN